MAHCIGKSYEIVDANFLVSDATWWLLGKIEPE